MPREELMEDARALGVAAIFDRSLHRAALRTDPGYQQGQVRR